MQWISIHYPLEVNELPPWNQTSAGISHDITSVYISESRGRRRTKKGEVSYGAQGGGDAEGAVDGAGGLATGTLCALVR